MNEKIVKMIVPAAISLAISGGAGAMNFVVTAAQMDARIASLEKDQARHELEKGKEISRLSMRDEDKEQRIIRLETNFSVMQETMNEVRTDVKTLLRGMGK